MFTGISFCRISALLVFPHERVQMFLKASLQGLLEARCWKKQQKLKGAVRVRERKAAGQGFPGYETITCCLGNSFTFLWEWALAITEVRDVLTLFQIFKIQITRLWWHSWILFVAQRSWDCNLVFQWVGVLKNVINKTCLSVWDTLDLEIGQVGPRKKEDLIWRQGSKINEWS